MKKINLSHVAAIMGIALCGIGATAAHADIVPGTAAPIVTAGPSGTFLFTYEIFVTNTQQVNPGNFFVMYDFAGFTSVSTVPTGWTASNQLLGPSPVLSSTGGVIPNDSATVQNVIFTYNGPTVVMGGPTSLGLFTIGSTLGGIATVNRAFVGAGTDQQTLQQNANITNYQTPGASPIPEPSEWAFAGFAGMSVLGLVARARRKNKVAA